MEHESANRLKRKRPNALILASAAGALIIGALVWATVEHRPTPSQDRSSKLGKYAVHNDIKTTVFWVGEGADASNGYTHNRASTWTENWQQAYGGIDDPTARCGYQPCGFTPKENPFYFALPYSDLDESCQAKPSQSKVPWFKSTVAKGDSIIKNHWIQIRFADKVAYAQWQDAGPFGEDDTAYVFGRDKPKADAGLDLSPATATYLGLDGLGQTSWRFIPENAVPDGPWRQTITTSKPDCAG